MCKYHIAKNIFMEGNPKNIQAGITSDKHYTVYIKRVESKILYLKLYTIMDNRQKLFWERF